MEHTEVCYDPAQIMCRQQFSKIPVQCRQWYLGVDNIKLTFLLTSIIFLMTYRHEVFNILVGNIMSSAHCYNDLFCLRSSFFNSFQNVASLALRKSQEVIQLLEKAKTRMTVCS